MRVALVYERLRGEERRLIGAIEGMGHDPLPIRLDPAFLPLGGAPSEVDVALIRAASPHRAHAAALALSSRGVRVVNPPGTLSTCGNVLAAAARLTESGIPTPRTAVAFSQEGALRAAGEVGYPVAVRTVGAGWGGLTSVARDEEDLRTILEHREAILPPRRGVHCIQELVGGRGNLRAYGTEEGLIAAIYSPPGGRSAGRARAAPADLRGELAELVVAAARAVGGGFLGVDLVDDPERGLLVTGVDAVSGFVEAERVTGVDIAGELVRYAVR